MKPSLLDPAPDSLLDIAQEPKSKDNASDVWNMDREERVGPGFRNPGFRNLVEKISRLLIRDADESTDGDTKIQRFILNTTEHDWAMVGALHDQQAVLGLYKLINEMILSPSDQPSSVRNDAHEASSSKVKWDQFYSQVHGADTILAGLMGEEEDALGYVEQSLLPDGGIASEAAKLTWTKERWSEWLQKLQTHVLKKREEEAIPLALVARGFRDSVLKAVVASGAATDADWEDFLRASQPGPGAFSIEASLRRDIAIPGRTRERAVGRDGGALPLLPGTEDAVRPKNRAIRFGMKNLRANGAVVNKALVDR